MPSNPSNKYIFIGLIVFIGLGVAGLIWFGSSLSMTSSTDTSSSPKNSPVSYASLPASSASSVSSISPALLDTSNLPPKSDIGIASKYRSGVYTAVAEYRVPDRETNKITIKVTLENDVIKDLSNEYVGSGSQSIRYKNSFESMIKNETIGKKIDQLNLANVGGASLTTPAFNQAIGQIINQAK